MNKLIPAIIHALLYDEQAVVRWTRGILLWVSTAAAQLLSVPSISALSTRELAIRFMLSALAGVAGLISVSPSGEKTAAKLSAAGFTLPKQDPPAGP